MRGGGAHLESGVVQPGQNVQRLERRPHYDELMHLLIAALRRERAVHDEHLSIG
jgi:hypothetical protein